MSTFKIWINSLRKNILLSIMKYIGASNHQNGKPIDKVQIKRVLIIRPNHRLGNQLMMTPVVQEVLETFSNCQIDLFAGKVSPVLFKNYERIDRIIKLPRKPFKELFKYLAIAGIVAYLILKVIRPLFKTMLEPPAKSHAQTLGGNVNISDDGEPVPQTAAEALEQKLNEARELAQQDPKVVANIIKDWTGANAS